MDIFLLRQRGTTRNVFTVKLQRPIQYGLHADSSELLIEARPSDDLSLVKRALDDNDRRSSAFDDYEDEDSTKRRRRGGFCEMPTIPNLDFNKFPAKEPQVTALLHQATLKNTLFKQLDRDEKEMLFRAMFECRYKAEDTIIREGDQGDNFYILTEGECEVLASKANGVPAHRYQPGDSFGELALIHGTPRKATVVAVTDCTLWGLERNAYRNTLMRLTVEKREKYGEFLHRVPLLSSLDKYDRMVIADCLDTVEYKDGETIIRQGEMGDSFFFVLTGTVRVLQRVGDAEGEVGRLAVGDYFGEIALLTQSPRQATCIAVGDVKCAYMRRDDFVRVMGPFHEKVLENIPLYKKYMP